eukprot:TRINITY_DN24936_c0_g1_i1.p4 TRINITY_DN24936_c0_g1~~TRINITY_DN24936_c0_g1_i1.p4  ORF type:complete len:198 (-),score=14.19 TRINITY_DN24936_c0_g1_i1:866-1399(-)
MGRSLRRAKKFRPKVRIGLQKRKKNLNSRIPLDLAMKDQKQMLQQKLGLKSMNWETTDTVTENYSNIGLVQNANTFKNINNVTEEQLPPEGQKDDIDYLIQNKPRTVPKKITPRQRRLIGKLIEAHGEDVEGMVKDMKLNPFLLSAGTLKRIINGYYYWKESDGVDFFAPRKKLWVV